MTVNLIKIFYIYLDCNWNIQNHLCILKIEFKKFPPILQIHSALGICGITKKLRKLCIKSRQKVWSLVRVETDLHFIKLAEKWFMTAWQLQELIETGLFLLRCTSDIHLRHYLTYLSSALQISKNKNEKISTFKHFCRFHGFVQHYKSTKLAERWEYFKLLAEKRFDIFSSELKLISNLQN